MRQVIRSIKNEINNYDEGERLVRELTSNEATPPSTQMLIKLKAMMTNQYQFPSIFNMLFKRLKDYDKIRHVEKALIVIEYLLKNADRKFVRYCQMEIKTISRLQRYRYILNYKDYGELIRKRAKRIYTLLKDDKKLQASRAKAQGYSMSYKRGSQYADRNGKHPQKRKQKQKHSSSQQKRHHKQSGKVRPQKIPKGQSKSSSSSSSSSRSSHKKSSNKSKKVSSKHASHQPVEQPLVKKSKSSKKTKSPKQRKKRSTPSNNATTNNNNDEPVFEAFIDLPAESTTDNASNIAAPAEDDLADWFTAEPNQNQNQNPNHTTTTSTEADNFGWYTAGNDTGADTGFGDDGGQFNFGDDEEFDADFDANNNGDADEEEEEEEEEDNIDEMYSQLTQIDGNILEVKKKSEAVPTRNTQGKTMAQMANANNTAEIPSSFDVAFINEALNNPKPANADAFDPFGLGNTAKTSNIPVSNMFGNNAMPSARASAPANTMNSMNSNPQQSNFGYQPKKSQSLYPYGNDPFADLSQRSGGQKYATVGMSNNVSRVQPSKQRDPFAQFNIK